MKKVHFNPRVQVRQDDQDMDSEPLQPVKLDIQSTVIGGSTAIVVVGVLVSLAVLGTWIAGLVKMGKCGGASSGYFWATLLLFLLLPGPGSVAGFIMAIIALVMLKPGKSALGMKCGKK